MFKILKGTLAAILSSKKGVAAIVGAATWGVGKLGLHLSDADVGGIVVPIVGYIIGQGLADHGKEAAVIQAAAVDQAAANTAAISAMADAIVKRIEDSLGGGKREGGGGIGTSP